MTQPIHTPGPLWIDDEGYIAAGRGDEYVTVADPNLGDFVEREKEALTMGNARLLAAAYNAFDSAALKLGLNAVELAERMQDGDLLAEVLENADLILYCTPHLDRAVFDKVTAIIDKVKGGTS